MTQDATDKTASSEQTTTDERSGTADLTARVEVPNEARDARSE